MHECLRWPFYEDIFLGQNTTEGKVKKFDETCWGARTARSNTATLERNEDLATIIICNIVQKLFVVKYYNHKCSDSDY